MGGRKQKGAARIDFLALPELPEERFRLAPSKKISLASAPARVDTLLPEDLHYKARPAFHPWYNIAYQNTRTV